MCVGGGGRKSERRARGSDRWGKEEKKWGVGKRTHGGKGEVVNRTVLQR